MMVVMIRIVKIDIVIITIIIIISNSINLVILS